MPVSGSVSVFCSCSALLLRPSCGRGYEAEFPLIAVFRFAGPALHSHVPVKVWQYAETRDEGAIFQIVGIGPTGIDYLNPEDDPRRRR